MRGKPRLTYTCEWIIRSRKGNWPSLMPFRGLLVGMADAEETAFSEGASQKLESYGKIDSVSVGKAAGEAQTADAGEVGGDREDVGQIHFEGIVGLLTQSEGRLGRGGGDDGVDLGEGLIEVAADQCPNYLSAEVVGIVVAATQDKGAQDNATLHFTTESFGAGLLVEREQVLGLAGASSVTDTVEAGKVG